ncbi:transmembrane amino acid transporter [Myriangium duriaei CBS 260.36]|uniref:Transmembrane amino acid transporter n=1 Tax=Myriangium duriaei CBS 260.36 TaxID=1168546 RepID=A0A9P4ITT4_9PEZI|nr:transmembrane amino acid transporter [Myriangium duriaei CBS 260.36]
MNGKHHTDQLSSLQKNDVEHVNDVSLHNKHAEPIEERSGEKAGAVEDAVFGTIEEGGPNYRNVGWLRTALLMMKTQIGIGALSIPGAFQNLGIVPGVIVLVFIASITTWAGHMVGCFKLAHPQLYGLDDAGGLIFGKVGKEILGIACQLYYVFTAASALLTVSTCLNALSDHAACTAVFVGVAAVLGLGMGSIQTLSRISWVAWVGLVCILISVFTITISVGVQDRPPGAPQTGLWQSDYRIVGHPSFVEAMSSISTIIFAFTGTPYFIPIISEMKNPRDYFKSLYACQAIVFTVYLIIGIIVYYYCGSYVASPALGSAGPMMKKVSYGLALPGLLVTTMIVCHVPAKNIFVRLLRGSRHLVNNTLIHWSIWLSCITGVVVIAYIIASVIPVFNTLLSLIGALLGTFITMQPYSAMWIYDNWSMRVDHNGPQKVIWTARFVWAIFVIVVGTFCMIAGTYSAVVDIKQVYKNAHGSAAWSCADNSSG